MTAYERATVHETVERLAAMQEVLAQQLRELQHMLDVRQVLESRLPTLPVPVEPVR